MLIYEVPPHRHQAKKSKHTKNEKKSSILMDIYEKNEIFVLGTLQNVSLKGMHVVP